MRDTRRLLLVAATSTIAVACVDIIGIHDIPDGATAKDGSNDALADAGPPLCDPYAPFTTTTPVTGLDSAGVQLVTLSPDEMTAFVCKYNTSTSRTALYLQKRSSPNGAFGSSTLVVDHGCGATISADGHHLLYAYDETPDGAGGNGNLFVLYQVKQADASALDAIGSGASIGIGGAAPYLLADDIAVYFSSLLGNGNGIERATSSSSGATLSGIPSAAHVPVVSPDDLVIYFSEGNVLSVASRTSSGSDFGGIQHPLSTDASLEVLRPAFLSADRCRLYYAHVTATAFDGSGAYSATTYVATRSP